MNKVAIFSDLHLGLKQDAVEWHNVALEWCDWFVNELKKNNINDIIFLGDFFHVRTNISVNTLYVASLFLDKLKDFRVHMIFGNHDLYYQNEATVSGVNLFKNKNNIIVYDKPTIVKFGNKSALFSGWGYNPLEYSADVLFTHAEIGIFKFNAELGPCNSGFKASELLHNFDIVYSGHFHLRQHKEWDNGKKIIYPGNPFSMDHSDFYGTIKGFDIFDFDTYDVVTIENTVSPKFCRMNLSEMCGGYYSIPELQENIKNNVFKLIVDKNITHKDLNILASLINSCRPFEFSYEWQDQIENKKDTKISFAEVFDLLGAINEFINLMDIDKKEVVRDYMINLYNRSK